MPLGTKKELVTPASAERGRVGGKATRAASLTILEAWNIFDEKGII